MADIQTQLPIKITNGTNTAVVTSGNALQVDGSAVTQPVSGSVSVSNFPATQPVSIAATVAISGSVSVSNFPSTQTVSGSVSVSNFPATQTVSGSVAVSSVGGTVSTVPGEVSTGVVAFYEDATAIANGAVGTITYTVTTGKTLYLKQVLASASGGPCKVVVNYGSTPTVIAVGFFSAAMPYINITFVQPIPITSTTAVNVLITNNAGAAQDVYATIIGHEQ